MNSIPHAFRNRIGGSRIKPQSGSTIVMDMIIHDKGLSHFSMTYAGRFVFIAFISDDQRRCSGLQSNASQSIFVAVVPPDDGISFITHPNSRHCVVMAVVINDHRTCVISGSHPDSRPAVVMTLIFPDNGTCPLTDSYSRPDVIVAIVG